MAGVVANHYFPKLFSHLQKPSEKAQFCIFDGPAHKKDDKWGFKDTLFLVKHMRGVFAHHVSPHAIPLAGVGENEGHLVFASVKPMVCKRVLLKLGASVLAD